MNLNRPHSRRAMLEASLMAGSAAALFDTTPVAEAAEPRKSSSGPRQSLYTAYEVGSQQGIDSLVMSKRKLPVPGVNEVLVQVRASAINSRDIRIMSAQYGAVRPPARVPLADGAGDVAAVGPGVTDVAIGDRVTACHFTNWISGELGANSRMSDLGSTTDGWLAEFAIIPAAALIKIPPIFSYEEAACLPVAAATVWHSIVAFGQIEAGKTLLTLGTGGVSTMALQLGRVHGARVAVTSSSDEKLERMKAMGADILVNYAKDPEWNKAILKATDGVGVDVVIETGGPETIARSIDCCALNGRIALLSSASEKPAPPFNLPGVLGKNLAIKGVTSGSRRMLEQAILALATNGVRPVMDKVFPFSQAREAYTFMTRASHIGKVLIRHG